MMINAQEFIDELKWDKEKAEDWKAESENCRDYRMVSHWNGMIIGLDLAIEKAELLLLNTVNEEDR